MRRLQAGQVNTKTGKFDAQNPPRGMSIEKGPDGQLRVTEGRASLAAQGSHHRGAIQRVTTFMPPARGAMDALDPVANELKDRWQRRRLECRSALA